MPNRSTETIQPSHDERVARSELIEELGQLRTMLDARAYPRSSTMPRNVAVLVLLGGTRPVDTGTELRNRERRRAALRA